MKSNTLLVTKNADESTVLKADAAKGIVYARIAGWTKDAENERFDPAAFTPEIRRMEQEHRSVPIYDTHDHSKPPLGYIPADEIEEKVSGLYAHLHFDLLTQAGAAAFRAVVAGTKEFSVGFRGAVSKMVDGTRVITDVGDFLETSICLRGVQSGTSVVSWKGGPRDGIWADAPLRASVFLQPYIQRKDVGALRFYAGKSRVMGGDVYMLECYEQMGDALLLEANKALLDLKGKSPAVPAPSKKTAALMVGMEAATDFQIDRGLIDEMWRRVSVGREDQATQIVGDCIVDFQALAQSREQARLRDEAAHTSHVAGAHREHAVPGSAGMVGISANMTPVYASNNLVKADERRVRESDIETAHARERANAVAAAKRQAAKERQVEELRARTPRHSGGTR